MKTKEQQGLKPAHLLRVAARLKSCPDTSRDFFTAPNALGYDISPLRGLGKDTPVALEFMNEFRLHDTEIISLTY
jgi:hypothetical protein